ncbi:MAG: hypothetical protein Tsb0010_05280 [Parvularculaceae bacterium]
MFGNWFKKAAKPQTESETAGPIDDAQLAAAALLVEAARADGAYDDGERDLARALLAKQFELDAAAAARALEAGERAQADAVDLHRFSRILKDALDDKARIAFVENLWMLILSDGERHDYEDYLVRRLIGLIYVSDKDSGAARRRAAARLGLDP